MALTPERIAELLKADADKPKTGRKPKGGIDTTIRDYQTWYKLNHKLHDEQVPDGRAVCSNSDCEDPRPPGQLVVTIGDKDMCRICFLGGYGLNGSSDVNGS